MRRLGSRIWTVIATVLVWGMIVMLAGCDASMNVSAKAFYPKENKGEVWKSRQANPEKPIWSWGEAGK